MDPDSSKSGEGGGENVFEGEGGGGGGARPTTPSRGRRGRPGRPSGPPRSPRSGSTMGRSASRSPTGGRIGGIDLDPYEMPAVDPWHNGSKPWTQEYLDTIIARLNETLTQPEHDGLLEIIDADGTLRKAIQDLNDDAAKRAWEELLERVDRYIISRIDYIKLLGKTSKSLTKGRQELEENKTIIDGLRTKERNNERWILGLENDMANVRAEINTEWQEKVVKLENQVTRYRQLASNNPTGQTGRGGGRGGGSGQIDAAQYAALEASQLELEEEFARREQSWEEARQSLQGELERLRAEKTQLQKKHERLKDQTKLVQKGLDEVSKSGSSSRSTESAALHELSKQQDLYEVERKLLQEKISDLEGRLATSEEKLKNQEAEAKKVYDGQLAKVREEHAQELAGLRATHVEESDALKKQISDLQSNQPQEFNDLREQHEQEAEKYRTQISNLNSDLETISVNNNRLSNLATQLNSDLSDAKHGSSDLTLRVAQLQSDLDASRASNAELRETIAQLRSELEASNVSNTELTNRIDQLSSDLDANNATDRELTAKVAQLTSELETSKARNKELESQIDELRSDLETSTASHGEGESRLLEQLTQLRADLSASNAANAELTNQVAQLTSQVEASDGTESGLLGQLTQARSELEAGKARNKELESQTEQLRSELDASKASNGEKDSNLLGQLTQLRAELDDSRIRNAQLSGQLAALESEMAQTVAERDAAQEQSRKFRSKLERVQEQLGLEELGELISLLPAALVPLPSTGSVRRSTGGSRIPRPIARSSLIGSKSVPLPKPQRMARKTPDPSTAVRVVRSADGKPKSASSGTGSVASSTFVDQPQSGSTQSQKTPATKYRKGYGYPDTMTQGEFDKEVGFLNREVAQLAPSRAAGEEEEQFVDRIRGLQLRAEDLGGYNSSSTAANETLAEAAKAMELLAGKLPDGYQDEDLFESLYSTLEGLLEFENKIAEAGSDEAKKESAVAEAIPPLDSILAKLKGKAEGPVHKGIFDLGTTLRGWAERPDTDKRTFAELQQAVDQHAAGLETLLVRHQKGFSMDVRRVDYAQKYIEALYEEVQEVRDAVEQYRQYKEEWGDKALSDDQKAQLRNLATELISKGEWTRPTALEGLLEVVGDFLPGHADMARQRAGIRTSLDALWEELAKVDNMIMPFMTLCDEMQNLIDNDQVLRNVKKLEQHRDILGGGVGRCHDSIRSWEMQAVRPLQRFLNEETREADERAQKSLTDTLVEVNAAMHRPDPSPETKDQRSQKTDKLVQTEASDPPPPPVPQSASPHLEGACFCTLFLYLFPNLYHSIVKGGCCSQGLMADPTTTGKRAGTQPSSTTDATARVESCKGHHGHGHLVASGDTYTLICNILTALIWFIGLILYSPYDFGLYILSLLVIPLSPFAFILGYLKFLYAYAIFKLKEEGREVPPSTPQTTTTTNPRAHPSEKGPNNRPLYAAPTRPAYPGLILPAIPSPGRLVSFAVITWTVYVTLVYLATYCERQIWLGANDHKGGWRMRGYIRELVDGTEPVPPYADWSFYGVDWRFFGDFGRWVGSKAHEVFYAAGNTAGRGLLGGVWFLDDDDVVGTAGGSKSMAAWFSKAASWWG